RDSSVPWFPDENLKAICHSMSVRRATSAGYPYPEAKHSGPLSTVRWRPLFVTQSKEARAEARLTKSGESAAENEPETLKYACFIPVDESEDKTLYVIEEYTGDEAFNYHMNLPHVQAMMGWLGEGNTIEGGLMDQKVKMNLTYIDDFFFVRPELKNAKNTFAAIAEIDYQPGGVEKSIPYWKAVVEEGRNNEPGTLLYGIVKDKDDENKLFAIEIYESKEYLYDVHVKSKAIEESIKNTKHLRTGLKHVFLKFAGGLLVKNQAGNKL
ncbi:hypothetical protein GE09DRAFT_1122808, partial [Coniochaeta sp. 2T2.1]